MDPRGPAPDGLSALERLGAHSADGFPHLLAARARTDAAVADLRAQFDGGALAAGATARLDAEDTRADVSVVLFGSWGRRELTEHSDDDWLLLVEREGEAEAELAAVREVLGGNERAPGTQGTFGVASSAEDLVRNVGLGDDTNTNLTRRMLLLLESVPVHGDDIYRRVWLAVLDVYLAELRHDRRPPRFFLNDLIRYWRTIAVDFAGKHRDDETKWGLRNAKLRTSRKLLFAGGLLPALRCTALGRTEVRSFLCEQLALPATDRVADAFLAAGQLDAGVRCLGAYDRWIGLVSDTEARAELAGLRRVDSSQSVTFREVRRLGTELQNGLNALLFETGLAPAVREYAIF
ncbi:hypothetical protein [Conexibacter woesei]|uniref:hypothetical protein n=1 Tax=Conexibacter woesei TaxID=191495 RepID=UPI00040AA143|nr:hypothetical protein [Conexibacter woesei]